MVDWSSDVRRLEAVRHNDGEKMRKNPTLAKVKYAYLKTTTMTRERREECKDRNWIAKGITMTEHATEQETMHNEFERASRKEQQTDVIRKVVSHESMQHKKNEDHR